MKNRIKRLVVWLGRAHLCRGFGVQSPTDYSFIRYVINEHYPYYAYEELQQRYPAPDYISRKLAQLYFRISNYRQPSVIVDIHPTNYLYMLYMYAGCRKTRIFDDVSIAGTIDILRITLKNDYRYIVEEAFKKSSKTSVFLFEGIKDSADAKEFWTQIQSDKRIGVTFDLYYLGVAFLDTDRYKENYIVNF
ncbi:MAG: hypothetical protein ACI4TW_00545 [Prevotella sp.]